MTYTFSQHSKDQLATCHDKLITLCYHVIKVHDFRVDIGHRGEKEQTLAYIKGASKMPWPNSKHNSIPSMAVDLLPYLGGKFIGWENKAQWAYFNGIVRGVASELGIAIRQGGDWNGDNNLKDGWDSPHIELI